LVTHTPNAIATITLFFFQMAILEVFMSALYPKNRERSRRTYMRSTINSDAATKARYPKIYREQ